MSLEWIQPYLQAVASGCTHSEACEHARCGLSTPANRASTDVDFKAAWDEAKEASADLLEREARRRAIDGVEEPVVYQGKLTPVFEYHSDGSAVMEPYEFEHIDQSTGEITIKTAQRQRQARNPDGSLKWLTIRKPSDALLAMLLKGRRAAVFGTDRQEISGPNGGPIESLSHDPDKRAQRLAALVRRAEARRDADAAAGDLTADDIV